MGASVGYNSVVQSKTISVQGCCTWQHISIMTGDWVCGQCAHVECAHLIGGQWELAIHYHQPIKVRQSISFFPSTQTVLCLGREAKPGVRKEARFTVSSFIRSGQEESGHF